jgi:hypothetical protein
VLASQRTNPTTFYLAGRHGLHVLLLALDPAGERTEFDRLTSTAMASMRWNRQFVRLGQAVLAGRAGGARRAGRAGRAGRAADAATAMAQAQQAADGLDLQGQPVLIPATGPSTKTAPSITTHSAPR